MKLEELKKYLQVQPGQPEGEFPMCYVPADGHKILIFVEDDLPPETISTVVVDEDGSVTLIDLQLNEIDFNMPFEEIPLTVWKKVA